jgi:hypothetical protein
VNPGEDDHADAADARRRAKLPERAVPHRDRRGAGQRPVLGGARANDPPLTTRDCADFMGMSPAWVRAAIEEGVTHRRRLVKLRAERLGLNGRTIYRVHLDQFIVFLVAIGWRRVPPHPSQRAAA